MVTSPTRETLWKSKMELAPLPGAGEGGGLVMATSPTREPLWKSQLELAHLPGGRLGRDSSLLSTYRSSPLGSIPAVRPTTAHSRMIAADAMNAALGAGTAQSVESSHNTAETIRQWADAGTPRKSSDQGCSEYTPRMLGSTQLRKDPASARRTSQPEPARTAPQSAHHRVPQSAGRYRDPPPAEALRSSRQSPQSALRYNRERSQSNIEACPMECPVEGHTAHSSERLRHVTERLRPVLATSSKGVGITQYSASQFRVFGSNAMVAWTAVQLCEVLLGTSNKTLKAAALWGLGSLVCEVKDLQNLIGSGNSVMCQIMSDAFAEKDPALQSCAAFALACLARFNARLQLRVASDRDLVQIFAAVLQGSTRSAVLFANLQAVGNICYNNLRAQQEFAAAGALGTIDALCHAKNIRIGTTANRCRATFLQLLSRGPALRVAVSQQGPFNRSPSQASSACTEPSARASEPEMRFSRIRPPSASLDRASPQSPTSQRPVTSTGRMHSSTSPLRKPDRMRQVGVTTGLPATGPAEPGAGWVPVKPTSPRRQASQGSLVSPIQVSTGVSASSGTGTYSVYQPNYAPRPPAGGSLSSPIMNIRRMSVPSPRRPLSDTDSIVAITWSTATGGLERSPFEVDEEALTRIPTKPGIPDYFSQKVAPKDGFMRKKLF